MHAGFAPDQMRSDCVRLPWVLVPKRYPRAMDNSPFSSPLTRRAAMSRGQIVVYAVRSLSVVRMLPVALALLGTGARRQTVAFVGWFGLLDLASIVVAVILWTTPIFRTCARCCLRSSSRLQISVYRCGVTARPPIGRYRDWWGSHPRETLPAMESVPAAEQRWRARRDPEYEPVLTRA
jgi:hypothetical protein